MLRKYIAKIKEKILRNCILGSNGSLYIKDEFGNLIRLYDNDNFSYLMKYGVLSDSYPMMRTLNKKIKKADIAFDVGANIGIVTMWLARNSRIVHSFEPEKNNLKRIRENLEINNFNNIVVESLAISNSQTGKTLYIHEGKGHHSLAPVGTTNIVDKKKVRVTTIDNYCKQNGIKKIDILKIDVEGFEKEVLEGAKGLLSDKAIQLIIFEVSEFIIESLDKKDSLLFIFNILSENGYLIFNLDGKNLNLSNFVNLKQDDVFAIPNKR